MSKAIFTAFVAREATTDDSAVKQVAGLVARRFLGKWYKRTVMLLAP